VKKFITASIDYKNKLRLAERVLIVFDKKALGVTEKITLI
jgi:hypothetical protein